MANAGIVLPLALLAIGTVAARARLQDACDRDDVTLMGMGAAVAYLTVWTLIAAL
jgi:hypothetical protein